MEKFISITTILIIGLLNTHCFSMTTDKSSLVRENKEVLMLLTNETDEAIFYELVPSLHPGREIAVRPNSDELIPLPFTRTGYPKLVLKDSGKKYFYTYNASPWISEATLIVSPEPKTLDPEVTSFRGLITAP